MFNLERLPNRTNASSESCGVCACTTLPSWCPASCVTMSNYAASSAYWRTRTLNLVEWLRECQQRFSIDHRTATRTATILCSPFVRDNFTAALRGSLSSSPRPRAGRRCGSQAPLPLTNATLCIADGHETRSDAWIIDGFHCFTTPRSRLRCRSARRAHVGGSRPATKPTIRALEFEGWSDVRLRGRGDRTCAM